MGLGGLLRARGGVLSGILNGIDETVWNPATDPHLAGPLRCGRCPARGRRTSGAAEALRPGRQIPDAMLFGSSAACPGRRACDLLLAAMPGLLAQGGELVVLGSGDAELETGFARRGCRIARPDRRSRSAMTRRSRI